MTLEERFWSKVDRRGPDECWPWKNATVPQGYGSLANVPVEGGRIQSQVGTHRITFFLEHGYWPRIARHTCDNPPCVNPRHIIDGSVADNVRDAQERGQIPRRGEKLECIHGHAYDEANTWVDKHGTKYCRQCARDKQRRRTGVKNPRKP